MEGALTVKWQPAIIALLRSILINGVRILTTLDQLRPGQRGNILRIDGFDAVASRLREMGFVPGESVEYLRRAPLGDPVKCSIHGCRVAVRHGEAKRVHVEPIG